MLKKLVLVVAAIALLAACGGSAPADKADKPPAEKVYTIEELKAALPGKDDVTGVSRVDHTCPDKVSCPEPEEGENVGIDLALLPPGDNSTDMEKAAHESLFGNSVSVIAWRHESSSEAAKSIAERLATNGEFDGAYDVKQKGDPKTGATPGEKGEGSLEVLETGAWKGHFLERRGSMSFEGTSEPRLIATAEVVQGSVTVSIYLNVQGDGRPADFADKLGRKVLADYLKRLG